MKKTILVLILCAAFIGTLLTAFHRPAGKNHFNHLALFIYDLKASADFYARVIQLDTIPEPFHDGRHVWFNMGEHNQLHLISGNTKEQQHVKDTHLCFSVASLEDFIAHLEKEKVAYGNWKGDNKAITTRADGIHQIYFQDPDGYWIEVNNDPY